MLLLHRLLCEFSEKDFVAVNIGADVLFEVAVEVVVEVAVEVICLL